MDTVASPAPARTASPGRWIRSPGWDLVWILNPLWLGPLVLVLARGHDHVRASPVDSLFFALTVLLWFGHRVSSAWLAYLTPAYRPLLSTQRLRFVVVPILVVAACFAVLLAPEGMLPLPFEERVFWLAVFNYLMVTHHFAAQHFGLLSLYRARAGRASDGRARRLDRAFALVVGGGIVVVADALSGSPGGCARRRSCRCCSRSASPPASSTTCSTAPRSASPLPRCGRRRAACSARSSLSP